MRVEPEPDAKQPTQRSPGGSTQPVEPRLLAVRPSEKEDRPFSGDQGYRDGSTTCRTHPQPASSSTALHTTHGGHGRLRRARARMLSIVFDAPNFTLGHALLMLAHAFFDDEDPFGNPISVDPTRMWVYTIGVAMVLVPVMGIVLRARQKAEEWATKAYGVGDIDAALRLRGWAVAEQTLLSWGCVFALTILVDASLLASISDSLWPSRAVYAGSLVFGSLWIGIIALVCRECCRGRCCEAAICDGIADAIATLGAYGVGFAYFGLTVTLFKLDGPHDQQDYVDELTIYTAVTVALGTFLFVVVVCRDAAAIRRASQELWIDALAAERHAVSVGTAMRKFLAGVFALTSAEAVYVLLHVRVFSDRGASIYKPLSPVGAVLFLALAMLIALAGGCLIEVWLHDLVKHLSRGARETSLPGRFDSQVLVWLHTIAEASVSTAGMALAWLLGTTLHGFVLSLWHVTGETDRGALKLPTACYVILMTLVVVAGTLCLAPRPAPQVV